MQESSPLRQDVGRASLQHSLTQGKKYSSIKGLGKVYTPDYLVDVILGQAQYCGRSILGKHIIDNSCGNGQFLIRIVDRYCSEFLKISHDLQQLKSELEKYIHGIEINKGELELCAVRCSQAAKMHGLKSINWDFRNEDATQTNQFDNKMDFVVGNPPYVRIHNLNDRSSNVKKHLFCKKGMTDLYILFYEIGLKMLNHHGTLAYITPSSFFTSLAGAEMRKYFEKNNLLTSVCDLKHFRAFSATTYTAIVCLSKSKTKKSISYSEFDHDALLPSKPQNLAQNDYLINGKYYFASKADLAFLKLVLNTPTRLDVVVKNGYATLADRIFIRDFQFKSKFIIPVLKASSGKWSKILYPYDKNGVLYSESKLFKDKNIEEYLLEHKIELTRRSNEKDPKKYYYAFGRSQAINDTYKDKLCINTLIRTKNDLKIEVAQQGQGVYSGLYIVSKSISFVKIKKALVDDDFCRYISLLGKYKSGGYYTFSSHDVLLYLNYKLSGESA